MESIINALLNLDGQALLFIQNHLRFDVLTPWVIRFTKLGNSGALWIVISVLLLFPKKTRRAGIVALLALLGSLLVTNLWLKGYVARIRPYEVIPGLQNLLTESEYSFPSGHASAAFAAGVAIYKSRPKRLGVPIMVVAVLISLSRLYVGVHFPSDIIAGAIIGGLIGLIMFWIFGEKEYKEKARKKRKKRKK